MEGKLPGLTIHDTIRDILVIKSEITPTGAIDFELRQLDDLIN